MTATDQITAGDLDAMEARANAATEGPWEVVQRTVDAMIEGDDECQYCADGVPLVSTEEFEGDDGTLAYTLHKHEAEPHDVSAGDKRITGNFDWEEGGILSGVDVVFIAHARTDVPNLTAEVRELRAQLRRAQDDAWKRGYEASRAGQQPHSPYRAQKIAVEGLTAPEETPKEIRGAR